MGLTEVNIDDVMLSHSIEHPLFLVYVCFSSFCVGHVLYQYLDEAWCRMTGLPRDVTGPPWMGSMFSLITMVLFIAHRASMV